MRYIKSYNESKESLTYSEILYNIKDILSPISDLGYEIEAKLVKDYVYHIFVEILNYTDKILEFTSEIEDEIIRLNEFVNNNGFIIKKIYYKKVESDGRIFNRNERNIMSGRFFSHLSNSNSRLDDGSRLVGSRLAFLSLELEEKMKSK